ncbi:hypothetical protein CSPX01_00662 [Colletotrichum filicis]|nr:hypothetical protein CSPX01_00662 [Colletotrichum filicis]
MYHPPQSLPSLATTYFELTVPYRLIVAIVIIAYYDNTTSTAIYLFKAGSFFSNRRYFSIPSHIRYSCMHSVPPTLEAKDAARKAQKRHSRLTGPPGEASPTRKTQSISIARRPSHAAAASLSNEGLASATLSPALPANEEITMLSIPTSSSYASDHSYWWLHLSRLHVRPFRQAWTGRCTFCSAVLLTTEKSGWCCVNGTRVASKLPPYPPDFQRWIDNTTLPLSAISRRLEYLFAFSAIGASEGFVHFGVPADVVVSGRVYHRLLDLSAGDHSMRWFLYDEDARSLKAANANVPLPAVQQTKHLIQSVNPYLSTIRHALQQVADEAIPLAVELKDSSLSGEVAAVINTQNLGTIDCRKVVFHRHGGRAQFVHILSRHYEPLQYPLLFPHGTLGWGIPALDEPTLRRSGTTGNDTPAQQANGLTQLQWYRALLLSEARFLTFGRLACEYLVDMYSRLEETNLDYLRRARSMQSSGLDEQTAEILLDSLRNRLPVLA